MSHKVHPYIFRLGQLTNWRSRWFFSKKKYREILEQDIKIREFLMKKIGRLSIEKIEIERSANSIRIIIYSARPGLIIGRGGEGIEVLRKEVAKILAQHSKEPLKTEIMIDIAEVRKPETQASIMAVNIAEQLEKRLPYRRVIKQAINKIMENKEVKGAKILVKGRLDGAEIARKEWIKQGELPLQNLRANIDYGTATAFTTYGTVGVKVWIYKGEIFEGSDKDKKDKS